MGRLGVGMDRIEGWQTDPVLAAELLAWQVEMGVTEALDDAPLDRFALSAAEAAKPPAAQNPATQPPATAAGAARQASPSPVTARPAQPQHIAQPVTMADPAELAAAARDLPALADAMEAFDGCELKRGARRFVFADGNSAARVMIIGEGPGGEEDRTGLPFVGPAGRLLDRMFAAIGMRRDHPDPARALYITNSVPWRPEGNRIPTDDEIALMRPFLLRHVALADPAVLVLMGNAACQAVLCEKGITRRRGQWAEALGRPVLPMFHPSALLRRPEWKREAWADLLTLQAKLRDLP